MSTCNRTKSGVTGHKSFLLFVTLLFFTGNSSVDKPGEWIPILRDTLPDSTQCSGLHMTLEILYTKLGALNIPQHRIVGQ